ncbi:MAG: DNA methyltransferase [Polyangia bacterium]
MTSPPRHTPRPAAPRTRVALSARPEAVRSAGDAQAAQLLERAFLSARDADPRQLTHGFHSYPARFHPEVVRTLLAARGTPGALVCDPFCGSGTTLVEALVAGLRGVGSDLNPLALELARMKALGPTAAHQKLPDELVAAAEAIGSASWLRVKARARTRTDGTQWDDPAMYASHVFRELVGLRELIDDQPKLGALTKRALLLSFSAILIKVSHQPSETGAGTVERTIGKGLPSRLFTQKAQELAKGLRELFARTPPGTPNPTVQRADARNLKHLGVGEVDLLVTSPPYLGTYDYAAHHARRLGWLGLSDQSIAQNEIGARRNAVDPAVAIATWQSELDEVVAQIARVLSPGGSAFIVIGDSRVGSKAIAGDRPIHLAAKKTSLYVFASCAELRKVGGRSTEEHLLELRHA